MTMLKEPNNSIKSSGSSDFTATERDCVVGGCLEATNAVVLKWHFLDTKGKQTGVPLCS